MALRTSLATSVGPVGCLVLDLSLGGARIEADKAIESGESIWLALRKARVFGTVQWVRDNVIGVQFEEKLPKALVLSLRGENVDPKQLEEVEAMLAARSWADDSPFNRPKSLRIADVLGTWNKGSIASSRSGVVGLGPSVSNSREMSNAEKGITKRAMLLILSSPVIGALIGIGSFLLF